MVDGLSQLPNLRSIKLFDSKSRIVSIDNIDIGSRIIRELIVISFAQTITGIDPNRHFFLINISHVQFFDCSQLKNVQSLSPTNCSSFTNVRPIKDVSFLQMSFCKRINNFSCLGSQKSLSIVQCVGLQDKDVERYGNILRLELKNVLRLPN
jgi:hypothetical protein